MAAQFGDMEAVRDDEEDKKPNFHDSSEEDEENEDLDAYEKDEFIVGDDEELNDDDDDDDLEDVLDAVSNRKKGKRKRRKYREDSPELAEGDLQLLEDQGLHVTRKKKLKKLRKGADDDDDIHDELRNLMDDESDPDEDRHGDRGGADDANFDYDDDMDDFIDDGGRGKRRRAAERKGLVTSDAVRAGRSIFGDAEDMLHYKPGTGPLKSSSGGGILDDDEDDRDWGAEDDEDDEEADFLAVGADGRRRRPNRAVGSHRTATAMRALADTTLEEGSIPPKLLEQYVQPDIPERLIRHFGPTYSTPGEVAIRQEAAWIYKYGFRRDPNCGLSKYPAEDVTEKIGVFLQYVHKDKLDIPFIAMYRKDYILPELICEVGENPRGDGPSFDSPEAEPHPVRGFNSFKHQGFRPGLSIDHLRGVEPGYDDGFGDWTTLWKIMDWDRKYAEYVKKRTQLAKSAETAVHRGVPDTVVSAMKSAIAMSENALQLGDCERHLKISEEIAVSTRYSERGGPDGNEDKNSRRPSKRTNRFADCVRKGYRGLIELYGLGSRLFAENVHGFTTYQNSFTPQTPNDYDDEPLECARQYSVNLTGIRPGSADSNPTRMLANARFVLVKEMATELLVIQTARSFLNKDSVVTVDTYPTKLGISEVGDDHPLRKVTYMSGRRMESFTNTIDFILIREAVKAGYAKINIHFQDEQVDILANILEKSYSSIPTGTMHNAKWNVERKLVANELLEELKKQIRGEIFTLLTDGANDTLKRLVTQTYSRRFLLGPTRPTGDDGAPKVLAIVVTREEDEEPDKLQVKKDQQEAQEKGDTKRLTRRPAQDRVTMVVCDENGEFKSSEELFAGWLMRPYSHPTPEAVVEQIRQYITLVKPHAIVVGIGSGGRSSIRLKDDLRHVLVGMLKEDQLDHMLTPDQLDRFKVEAASIQGSENLFKYVDPYVTCIDESAAKLYAHSKWATVGLPVEGITLLEKRGLALARMAQEPLTIYTSIATDPDVAPRLAMHENHFQLRPAQRQSALVRALVRSVCTTGVDVNRLMSLPHHKCTLEFVGGLGKYKAHALMTALEKAFTEDDKVLPSRKDLWTKEFLGRGVFMSAAAFLRVRDPELHFGGSTEQAVNLRKRLIERSRSRRARKGDDDGAPKFFDPMDDSRIHPEHYAVAIKIADESLRNDDGDLRIEVENGGDIPKAARVTAAVLDDPSGLRRLALDEYAEHLYSLQRGKLYETVKLIAREFHGTFADFRRPLVSPHSQAIFYMTTKASPYELRVGSKLMATQCRIAPRGDSIFCKVSHNVQGVIFQQNFSDEELNAQDFKQLVPDGCSINCRVMMCEWDRFRVRLAAKLSVLNNPKFIQGYVELVDTSDSTYRPYPKQSLGAGLRQSVQEVESRSIQGPDRRMRRKAPGGKREKTVVSHRHYRDITGPTAVETLRNALPGDVIIRPSAYNKDAFIFSCKFAALENPQNTVPRDIFHIEFVVERNPGDDETMARLRIGTDAFDDIDEALEQFIHPIIGNLKEALDNRKFRNGAEDSLKTTVHEEKKAYPKTIPYYIGLSEKRDLHLILAYVPGTKTPRLEYIQVIPHGYRFREVLHQNLEGMYVWFKKNMNKSAPLSRSISRPGSVRSSMPGSPFVGPASGSAAVAMATPLYDAPPPTIARSPFHPSGGPAAPPNPVMARSPFVGTGNGANWNQAVPSGDAPPPSMQNGGPPGQQQYMRPQGIATPVRGPQPRGPPGGDGFNRGMSGPPQRGPPPPGREDFNRGPPPPGRDDFNRGPPPSRGPPPMGNRGPPPMMGGRRNDGPPPPGHFSGRGPPPGRDFGGSGQDFGRGMPPGRNMPPGRGMPMGRGMGGPDRGGFGRGMPPNMGRGGGRGGDFNAGRGGMGGGPRMPPSGRGGGRGLGLTLPAWKQKELEAAQRQQ